MRTTLLARHGAAVASGVAVAAVASMIRVALASDGADVGKIRAIVEDEIAAWNRGDADAYSRHFSADGTFTNIRGSFFVGYEEFRDRHDVVFKGEFRGTTLEQRIVSLKFIRPDVAVVETLASVSGFESGVPPSANIDEKGRLNARLLQVLEKEGSSWKIVAYHNVDVKPGVPIPEPR
jgi:uncharacterized protein (TIGR02246 family)